MIDLSIKLYDANSKFLSMAAENLKDRIEEFILDERDFRNLELGMKNWIKSLSCSSNTNFLSKIEKKVSSLVARRESAENLYVRIMRVLEPVKHRDTLFEHTLSAVSEYRFLSVEELPETIKKKLQAWPAEISRRKRAQVNKIMSLRFEVAFNWGIKQ